MGTNGKNGNRVWMLEKGDVFMVMLKDFWSHFMKNHE